MRHALAEACLACLEHDELRDAEIEYRRFTDPAFASWLDRGMSVAEALLNVSAVPYALLNEPGDLAFVAYVATDWLGALDCEPGSPEHAAELKREQTDAHARAVALLEGALAIMRAADPQDPYRSFLANQSKESLT